MILAANDIVDWIADRQQLLVATWTTEIAVATEWDLPFAEALASELALLNAAGERGFLDLVARSNTGLSSLAERQIAERFFGVTLKLGRAACRSERERRNARTMPFKRRTVVGDERTDPAPSVRRRPPAGRPRLLVALASAVWNGLPLRHDTDDPVPARALAKSGDVGRHTRRYRAPARRCVADRLQTTPRFSSARRVGCGEADRAKPFSAAAR
jgi:hypothetical protein